MNDANRESIMKMVGDGTLRPEEAAKLLARLSEEEAERKAQEAAVKSTAEAAKVKPEKTKPPTEKITVPGPDGTEHTIEVPSSLVPKIMSVVGDAMKQHAKKVVRESVAGAKVMARNKYDEVKDTLSTAIKGGNKPKEKDKTEAAPAEDAQFEARRRILQMVQNGRISASDAGRLIQELDALKAFEAKQATPTPPPAETTGRNKRR